MDPRLECELRRMAGSVIEAATSKILPRGRGSDISKIQSRLQGGLFTEPAPTVCDGDPASTGAMLAAMVLYAWGYRP